VRNKGHHRVVGDLCLGSRIMVPVQKFLLSIFLLLALGPGPILATQHSVLCYGGAVKSSSSDDPRICRSLVTSLFSVYAAVSWYYDPNGHHLMYRGAYILAELDDAISRLRFAALVLSP